MQKSSLGASNILKHHFKPVIVTVWSLTAPNHTYRMIITVFLPAFHITGRFLQGKSFPFVKKIHLGYAFCEKVGVKAVGEQGKRQNELSSVFCSGTGMCVKPQTYSGMTKPSQAQIWLCSGQSNQCIRVWL